jgi:hypothetical protein
MQYPVCVRTSIDSTILKSQVLYFKVEKLENQKRQEAHFAERYPQDPTRTCKSGSSNFLCHSQGTEVTSRPLATAKRLVRAAVSGKGDSQFHCLQNFTELFTRLDGRV